jgi:hypothetical protein
MLQKLRQKAQLYRRLASIPTTGGHDVDRVLREVADDLERKAAELETQATQQRGRPRLYVGER